jgi:hypothetical protein
MLCKFCGLHSVFFKSEFTFLFSYLFFLTETLNWDMDLLKII